jgi:hypothetical protein
MWTVWYTMISEIPSLRTRTKNANLLRIVFMIYRVNLINGWSGISATMIQRSGVLNKAGSSVLKINTGEVVENGERVIKLVFPVQNNTDWNGYAYTTRTNEPDFYYRSTSKTFSSPAGNFVNVAEVIQENDSNLIEKRFRSEWYAPLVGLVYKQIDSLETQFDNQGNPETKGYRYFQRLRSFTP